jgi:nitroreductase
VTVTLDLPAEAPAAAETLAVTEAPATTGGLHPLLATRRSSRNFDPVRPIDPSQLARLIEAARWAPSAGNTQPWRFGLASRGEPAFDALFASLDPANRVWAGAASALVVVAATLDGPDGHSLPWAAYDAGQAAAHLTVQAQAEGLMVHQMGGFDADAVRAVFALQPNVTPLVVIAVGWHCPDLLLPEPFAARERAPRTRKPVEQLLLTSIYDRRDAKGSPSCR